MTVSLQAKYQLITETPNPNKCAGCGVPSTGRNQFLDFNLSLDYYGAVIFCLDCAKEIAATVGFVDPELLDDPQADLEAAERENKRLGEKLEALENVVFTYRLPVSTPHSPDPSDHSDPISDKGEGQGSLFS